MSALQKYVPLTEGKPYVLPCHGDQLSVERMTDAKRARQQESTPIDRLAGLEQVPQEFHHRGIILQVFCYIIFC